MSKKICGRTYSDVRVQLAPNDTDVIVKFPNGKEVNLQFRVEGPSIDINLPENLYVYNWLGSDMKPAKKAPKSGQEVRMADQLCIPLMPDYLDETE